MSMLEGLASTLSEMGFAQLGLIFLAVGAYSIAINGSFGAGVRSGAASAAFASSVGFSTLAPSWMSGVVFLALAVLAVAPAGWSRCCSASAPSAARSSSTRNAHPRAPRRCRSCAASPPA
jgi:hypothetical protein